MSQATRSHQDPDIVEREGGEGPLEQCSVGVYLKNECHKASYKVKPAIYNEDDIAEEQWKLILARVGHNISTICAHHAKIFIEYYSHHYGRNCCDPLKLHADKKLGKTKKLLKRSKITLYKITYERYLQCSKKDIAVAPGKVLCRSCNKQLNKLVETVEEKDTQEDTPEEEMIEGEAGLSVEDVQFEPLPEIHLEDMDKICEFLELTPIKNTLKLAKDKRKGKVKRKLSEIEESSRRKIYKALGLASDDETDKTETPELKDATKLAKYYEELIDELKLKLLSCNSFAEKVQVLTLAPKSWSGNQIAAEFKVSRWLAYKSVSIRRDHGILPDIQGKIGRKLSIETLDAVKEMYHDDEYTRSLPGMNDALSVRVGENKIKMQKRLIMCDLKELHKAFLERNIENPQQKVGFSTFAKLRPKWCVIAGTAGTHAVCVCTYHQNVKLMIEAARIDKNYVDLLAMMVCSLAADTCMLGVCDKCPGSEPVTQFLQENEILSLMDEIKFSEWKTGGHCHLVDNTLQVDQFITMLVDLLQNVKTHHFIAKHQANYLTKLKAELDNETCILLGDFAENYTFVVQDAIQSFYWTNSQATLHPFVAYIHSPETGTVKPISICVISDCLQHTTSAVYAFQKVVIPYLKTVAQFKMIKYWSDGAGGQYKNRYNFGNLLKHEEDFGVTAEWHNFATSHGKSTCDGVGGTVKREARKVSLQRDSSGHILTPEALYEFGQTKLKGIKFFFVTSKDIENAQQQLKDRFLACHRIPNTRTFHSFIPIDANTIRSFRVSGGIEFQDTVIFQPAKPEPPRPEVNKFIGCVYDDKWYIGMIVAINEDEQDCKVKFMIPAGPSVSFHWEQVRPTWLPYSNILKTIEAPITETGRSYKIPTSLSDELNSLLIDHLTDKDG